MYLATNGDTCRPTVYLATNGDTCRPTVDLATNGDTCRPTVDIATNGDTCRPTVYLAAIENEEKLNQHNFISVKPFAAAWGLLKGYGSP